MKDQNKTKARLVADLEALRQRVAELEALEVERKRAEEEIRRAKEDWERTFDAIPDLVAILDDEQRIVRSNNAMASGLGLSLEELVGAKCYHCFHGAEEPPLSCPFILMAQDGQTHSEEVYVERVGRDFLVTTSPLYDAQGRVSGGVHVAHDITDRKRAEDKLRESEARFRDLAELLPQIIYEADRDGNLTYVNRRGFSSFGYTLQDIDSGFNVLQSVIPEDRPRIQAAMPRVLAGEASGGEEFTALRKDGTTFPVLIYSAPIIFNGQLRGMRGLIVDITERKQMKAALEESEEIFRLFMEYSPIYVFFKDEKTRPIRLSKNYEKMLGRPVHELLGKTMDELFPSELAKSMTEDDLGILRDGKPIEVIEELNGRTYTTTKFPIMRQGTPSLLAGFTIDITERKQAEKVLQASETRYRRLFESARDGILILDADTGQIIDANPFLTEMLGYSRAEFLGKALWEIGSFRDIATSKAAFMELQSKGYIRYEDLPLETSDGRRIDVEFVSNVYLVDHMQVVQCNIRDITERKRAEEALARHDREMAALYETLLEINSLPDVSTLLHAIVRRACELLELQAGALYLVRPDGETLELVVSHNLPRQWVGIALRVGEGLAGRVAQTGEPMMVGDYLRWEERVAAFADTPARRVLGVPLKVRGQITGVIIVIDPRQVGPFSKDEVRLLSLFADQAAIAVENARLVEALRRQNEYRAALQETTLDLISRLNLDNLLENIVKRAGQLMGTSDGFLDLVDPETNQLKPKAGLGALAEALELQVQPGEGLAGTIWQTGKPLVIDDYDAWPGRIKDYSYNAIRSVIGVPLLSGSQVLGVLGLAYDTATHRTFGQEAVELLSQFARLAAIAIENARLYEAAQRELAERKRAEEALQRRNHDLSQLIRVGQTLSATLDPQEVTARLMLALTQAIGAEGSSVWLWDEEQPGGLICRGAAYPGLQRSLIGWRLGPGEGVATWVAQHGQSVIVPSVSDDPRFSPRIDSQIGFRTASLLVVPLRVRDQVIGALEAVNKHDGEFDPHDRFLLETLAPSAAIAIENARLVEALRQSNAELEARNEELDAFAHTVAHDLKNPLGPVVGFAEILIRDHTIMTEDERQRCMEAIARSGRKIKSIIEELLLLAEVRQVQVATEPLDMSGIVSEALQRLTDAVEQSRAEIVWPDVSAWPVARGYTPWVEEVWINYLSNALKYGGRPPRIELGAQVQPEGMTRFWVRDNGPGIPPEAQSRLFTPFTRLDQVRAKGHGLGLSIVRRIVEKLGGQVGVESQTGQGSAFYFTLPGAPI